MYVHAFSYGNRIRRSSTLIIVRLVYVAIATVGYWYRRRKRRGREEEEKEERRRKRRCDGLEPQCDRTLITVITCTHAIEMN